ncbi:cytochrome P450 [Calidifontibacter terrae]
MSTTQLHQQALDQSKAVVRWGAGHALPRLVLRAGRSREDIQTTLIRATAEQDNATLFRLYDELHAGKPFVKGRFTYLAGDHATVRDVLSSNDVRVGQPDIGGPVAKLLQWSDTPLLHPLRPPSLLAVDGPQHARYRKMVTRVFTARAVEALRGTVEKRARQLLDDLVATHGADATVDLAQTYCADLPVVIISEILGVPDADHARVLAMGTAAAPSLDFGLPWRSFRSVERSLLDFDAWLSTHLEKLRREPGDDLLSQLVQQRDEKGGLDEWELKSTAGLVLAAGFETTVNLLGNAIALLADHPDQLAAVTRDPSLWGNVVEETLRFDPPVLLTGRVALRDTEINGGHLPAGAMAVVVLGAAGRDPRVFDNPGVFDVRRENARDHIAFSGGRHYCLGAALARLEGEVGLRVLFERFPQLRLTGQRERRPTRILRGFEHLPAVLG